MKANHDPVSPLCIAGAHRSGTSMLTRLLHTAGLALGPAGDMMLAQEDNPDGFWENLRFVALNDEVLNELGGAWDLPPPPSESFQDQHLEPLRLKARILIESFTDDPAWGWKDPRNCLTLPFWRELLPTLKVVVIVRNPLEVAYSMHKRNGTSYVFGLRLWEIYNRRLLSTTAQAQQLITSYESFFHHPERELRRVARFAGLTEKRIEAAVSLVARNRRHTSFTVNQLVDARVSTEIIELYRDMIALAETEVAEAEPEARAEVYAPAPDLSGAELLAGAPNRLHLSVPEGEEVREELALLRGMTLEHEHLRADLPHLRESARQEGRIHELQESLARRDDEVSAAAEKLAAQNAEIGAIRERLVRDEHEWAERLRRQLRATRGLTDFLAAVEVAVARLRSSRRWRLANPMAALRAAFSGQPLRGYGHLEGIVEAYAHWKSLHPAAIEAESTLRELGEPGLPEKASSVIPPTESRVVFQPRIPDKPLCFRAQETVDISIIIPVFNQLAFTKACLASIQEHEGAERFEVIVVDDGSTDATADEIPPIPGLVYLRTKRNAGFIAACNGGARQARGQFLVFLNNDTEVTAGWLSALRETFALHPRAGLVGAKLLYPDGRLQEAGGIIWRDASGWNYGRSDDPAKAEYNFLREVDYCSGACLMIPKTLFETLGGFDAKYSPAFYEDTDLAFKVRRHGRQVLYQPLSKVFHCEGATGGTDLSRGTKKYQDINRITFAATWANVLAKKAQPGDLAAHETLPPGKKRILVIDHHLPTPDRDAGSQRMFHIVTLLRELGHRVTFLPDNLADLPPYGAALQKRGIEVVFHPQVAHARQYLEAHGPELDVVILSRCEFAQKHIADVRAFAPRSRIIFDTVDLHFLRQTRQAEMLADPAGKQMALERQNLEYALIDQADETWVVSDFEHDLLRRTSAHNSIEIVSMIVDVDRTTTPFALRRDFLFIGSFQHPPNADAVIAFAKEILPLVRARLPKVRFYIIGGQAPPEVLALADENVIITGYQPDVRPFFEQVKMSIAPLRWGAGVKGKINQSMGWGLPVVATTLAAEGMLLSNREDILIADGPEAFAAAMIELYESEDLWQRLAENGLAKTRDLYSCAAAREQLARLLSDDHLDPAKPSAPASHSNGRRSSNSRSATPAHPSEVERPTELRSVRR